MTKPLIIIHGDPGLGKSYEALKTGPGALAIFSSRNNGHFFFTRLRKGKLPNKRFPRKIKLIDVDVIGTTTEDFADIETMKPKPATIKVQSDPTKPDSPLVEQDLPSVPQRAELLKTIHAVLADTKERVKKGEAPKYGSVIIDEWGEFMDRIHNEIEIEKTEEAAADNKKVDGRKIFGLTDKWVFDFMNDLKQLVACGVSVYLVLHSREAEGNKKGGPKAPSYGISTKNCAMADGVLRRYMKDPPLGAKDAEGRPLRSQRLWAAKASEDQLQKIRGLEPEDEDRIATMELEEILELCGFEP